MQMLYNKIVYARYSQEYKWNNEMNKKNGMECQKIEWLEY